MADTIAASVSEQPLYDLCLDGIFGFQFTRRSMPPRLRCWRAVNAHPSIRLRAAVDLPSGVGEQPYDAAFRADFTYATGSVKTPLLEERNRGAMGRLRYCDLGFFDQPVAGVADPGSADPALSIVAGSLAPAPRTPSRAL